METLFLHLPSNYIKVLKITSKCLNEEMSVHEKNEYLHYVKSLRVVQGAMEMSIDTIPYDITEPWSDLSRCLERGFAHLFLYSLEDGFWFLFKLFRHFEDEQWIKFLYSGAKIVIETSSIRLLKRYYKLQTFLGDDIAEILNLAINYQKRGSLVKYLDYLYNDETVRWGSLSHKLDVRFLAMLIYYDPSWVRKLDEDLLDDVFRTHPETFDVEVSIKCIKRFYDYHGRRHFAKLVANNPRISLFDLLHSTRNIDVVDFIFNKVDEERITSKLCKRIKREGSKLVVGALARARC